MIRSCHKERLSCEMVRTLTHTLAPSYLLSPATGDWAKADVGREFNKLLLMSDHPTIVRLRPQMEELLGQRAALTSALPGMIEVCWDKVWNKSIIIISSILELPT